MLDRSTVNYLYDGSFDGLLSCIFLSFKKKEIPGKILPDFADQLSVFESVYVETDIDKASRVAAALKKKVSAEAYYLVNRAFLSCLEDKELFILKFVHLCFKIGSKACTTMENEDAIIVRTAARRVANEAGDYLGFVRFSEIRGALVSVIEPKNYVLPLISRHFCDRFPDDVLMMYDKTHKMLMLAQNGKYEFTFVDALELPENSGEELYYRQLWKNFYDTIGIENRYNPKCRMSHMPKRYWGQLPEFEDDAGELMLPGDTEKKALSQ